MATPATVSAADHLLRVAKSHPEYLGGEVLADDEVRIDIRVEMPLHLKADGISDTGVRTVEPVTLRIPAGYPWLSPRVELRDDFPRDFPHLFPSPPGSPARPCLVDGDQDEFFLQFGLVEYGLFHLLEQVAVWLRKAAISHLIDPAQGWEPAMRRGLIDVLSFDADQARATALKGGGYVAWKARFTRIGTFEAGLRSGGSVWIESKGVKVPLSTTDKSLFTATTISDAAVSRGGTVIGVVWPDKPESGGPLISGSYAPDDVTTLAQLRERAVSLGCRRGLDSFISNVERSWRGQYLDAPIPLGIILSIRRPFNLIGSSSSIELLPYVIEMRPVSGHTSLFPGGDAEAVSPAIHFQTLSAGLLRTLSGVTNRVPLVMLGCGSVGSKLAVHAARSGQPVVALSDNGRLRPHNMARHALYPERAGMEKVDALAEEMAGFGLNPLIFRGNIATTLLAAGGRAQIVPPEARMVVNATASLAVREALTASMPERDRARYAEAALFGRGRMAYLLLDGAGHNPSHGDLMAELYATIDDPDAAALLSDPVTGLQEVQVGQGCGSLTMTVDDAQLSMMTAGLAKEVGRATDHPQRDGMIVTGISDADTPTTRWTRRSVAPFEMVAIDGTDGWRLRISPRVAERIRAEAARFEHTETGGLLIGLSSARLRTVTVVDLLDPPVDSTRSAGLFVLGTQGLHAAITARHRDSGRTLFDVGTWHSHLADEGPSPLDWRTASELAVGRAPPSVLLIVTPRRFHALIAREQHRG